MKKVFGYIRVSTVKQGEGVSLIEQKEAIKKHAEKYRLEIIEWFEEKVTAAKKGRPLFNKMIQKTKEGEADGIIIHKIDRGARNLSDWTRIGDLLDQGVEVHFAHENIDLQQRSGRLSADIQAVIASDYIRNLRDEAVKGLYGRLKQGIYPFGAPLGYLDTGKGKVKAVDPIKGPLVKQAFELYATQKYSLRTLTSKLYSMGLRNKQEKKINIANLSKILNNPFYKGLIRVKGRYFDGKHEPLISAVLFRKVQLILSGKANHRGNKFFFAFRRMIRCRHCNYLLVGERQRGHVYYRCHTPGCQTKTIREERVGLLLRKVFEGISLLPGESKILNKMLNKIEEQWKNKIKEFEKSFGLQLDQIESRISRLTDAYVDNLIDKEVMIERRENLLEEKQIIQAKKQEVLNNPGASINKARNFLEHVKDVANTYDNGNLEEKRELIETVTSNIHTEGKNLIIAIRSPFFELFNRHTVSSSGLERDTARTLANFYHEVTFVSVDTSPIKLQIDNKIASLLMEEVINFAPGPDDPSINGI